MFKTILCAVDFSRHSERALDYALSVAQESGGRLLLVHVLEPFDEEVPRLHAHYEVPEFRRTLEAEAHNRLLSVLPEWARTWCEADTVLGHGRADRELLRIATERRADVLVLGIHGRNALNHALFGSTAARVLHGARIPVLTVPAVRQTGAAAA